MNAQWCWKCDGVRWSWRAEDVVCTAQITFSLNYQPYPVLLVQATPTDSQCCGIFRVSSLWLSFEDSLWVFLCLRMFTSHEYWWLPRWAAILPAGDIIDSVDIKQTGDYSWERELHARTPWYFLQLCSSAVQTLLILKVKALKAATN